MQNCIGLDNKVRKIPLPSTYMLVPGTHVTAVKSSSVRKELLVQTDGATKRHSMQMDLHDNGNRNIVREFLIKCRHGAKAPACNLWTG